MPQELGECGIIFILEVIQKRMRYTFENVLSLTGVAPTSAVAGAITGSAIDTAGYGDGMVVVQVGATTGTPTSFTVDAKVQESADGSSGWADISGDSLVQVTSANKTGEIKIALGTRSASKRYVRVVVTPAFSGGTSPTVGVGAVVILGNPEVSPTVNSKTAN